MMNWRSFIIVSLHIVCFITVISPAYSEDWLEEVHYVPGLSLDNVHCLRVNDALSDKNNVHMIVCQGCDLLHLKLTRTDSGWQEDWMEKLTSAPAGCSEHDQNHIQDAIFLPAGRNALDIIYLDGSQPKITQLRYRLNLTVPGRRIKDKQVSWFSNRGLGICTGLHNFNIPHHQSTVLIADSSPSTGVPHSGRSVRSLNMIDNQTSQLAHFQDYPFYFSADPSNSTNVFFVSNTGLRKLVFDGNQYRYASRLAGDEGLGTKVLALTSSDVLILPFKSEDVSGVVSLNLKQLPLRRQSHLTQYHFTSLDLHKLSQTLFLTTDDKIFYNVTSNRIQPTALPKTTTTPTTTRTTTTRPATHPLSQTTTPPTETRSPIPVEQVSHLNIIMACTAGIGVLAVIGTVLGVCYCKNRRKTPLSFENQNHWERRELPETPVEYIAAYESMNFDRDSTRGQYEQIEERGSLIRNGLSTSHEKPKPDPRDVIYSI